MAQVEVKYTIPAQNADTPGYQADIIFTYDPSSMGSDGSVVANGASGTVSEIDQNGNVYVVNGVAQTDKVTGIGDPNSNYTPSGQPIDNKIFLNPTSTQHYIDQNGVVYTVSGPWSDDNSNRHGPDTGDNVIFYGTVNDAGTNLTGYHEYTNSGSALNATSFSAAPVCFATGTRIETTRGDVAVEDLQCGDVVLTADGALRTIEWIGHREVVCADERVPWETWPVRVSAGAFGHAVPRRDLYLSPGHPVLVGSRDGEVLVPIMCLVNGNTIERVRTERVTYWHIELEQHDILLAEGLPAESFLDCGNRTWFENSDDQALSNPDFLVPNSPARCRPVVVDGPAVEAERLRLTLRFEATLHEHCGWPGAEAFAFDA